MTATVERLTTELVVPAEETPAGAVWLSNLDLAARRGYTPTVYFYRADGRPGFFEADAVRDSLARALVAFYPLAGRLGLDGTGRVQIDCTGEGAVFVTARSERYALDDLLNEFVPCDAMRDMLVPATPAPNPPCPLLFAQLTRLRCGGVVLGQAMHHSVCDARGAAHFFETWASIARGDAAAAAGAPVPPCFDHGLLAARPGPARAVLYDHPEYKPEPEPVDAAAGSDYASAILTMTKAQVGALKARCPGASTFRAVAALVWRCACRARALPPEAETRLYSMIDMRARLAPPLPPGYFGNAVVRTSVSATAGEVLSNPVGHAARRGACSRRRARAATTRGRWWTTWRAWTPWTCPGAASRGRTCAPSAGWACRCTTPTSAGARRRSWGRRSCTTAASCTC